MFLEYRVPFLDITVETAIWLGQNVLLGCNDGNVYLLNPFKVVQQVWLHFNLLNIDLFRVSLFVLLQSLPRPLFHLLKP